MNTATVWNAGLRAGRGVRESKDGITAHASFLIYQDTSEYRALSKDWTPADHENARKNYIHAFLTGYAVAA